jgi:hypothetical protein
MLKPQVIFGLYNYIIVNNLITCQGAMYISNMLRMNDCLNVLLLNWNKILSKGGTNLCRAIERNGRIQVYDISFNNIGGDDNKKLAESFNSLFLNNQSLIHLDISHCKLSIEDLKVMSKWMGL